MVQLDNSQDIVILDATAFYADVPFTSQDSFYSTDSVIKEVSHKKSRETYIEGLVQAGRLKIFSPSKQYLVKVKEVAQESGDISTLSSTDISVVALSLEFKSDGKNVTIISDDYAVQNLADILGLKAVSVMSRGIKKTVKWIQYCSGCGKVYNKKNMRECIVCGSSIKRKFQSTNNLNEV